MREGSWSVGRGMKEIYYEKVIRKIQTACAVFATTVCALFMLSGCGKQTDRTKDADFLTASEYEIGDKIEVVSGTEDELKDSLERTSFKIVGCGNSPLYFALDRGSSSIGNGSVSGFMVVLPARHMR